MELCLSFTGIQNSRKIHNLYVLRTEHGVACRIKYSNPLHLPPFPYKRASVKYYIPMSQFIAKYFVRERTNKLIRNQ